MHHAVGTAGTSEWVDYSPLAACQAYCVATNAYGAAHRAPWCEAGVVLCGTLYGSCRPLVLIEPSSQGFTRTFFIYIVWIHEVFITQGYFLIQYRYSPVWCWGHWLRSRQKLKFNEHRAVVHPSIQRWTKVLYSARSTSRTVLRCYKAQSYSRLVASTSHIPSCSTSPWRYLPLYINSLKRIPPMPPHHAIIS